MKVKTSKGITLIALIITIIVLLILAGVTIATLTGENGLLNKAATAKETTEKAEMDEKIKLAVLAAIGTDGKVNLADVKEELDNQGVEGTIEDGTLKVTTDNKEYTISENGTIGEEEISTPEGPTEKTVLEYATAAMPAEASIKSGTTEETGIVMIDSKENEWVWIEVPEEVFSEETTATDYDAIKADLIAYATDCREGRAGQGYSWSDEWYDGCGIASSTEYTTMYNKMLSSIYTNKGFYISRYEAGIEGSDTDTSLARTARTEITDSSRKAVSKPDMIPYNYVYCSDAQKLASEMTTDENKTSSLLFGIQWDLVCKYLEEKSNLEEADINSDSSSWGNYSGKTFTINSANAKKYSSSAWSSITGEKSGSVLLTTGASEYTNKMNIYDFAGNEYEWTLEHATTNSSGPCAYRGGGYNYTGSDYPASYRNSYSTTVSSNTFGFRCSLY